ncbi:MAG TPA: helix-turn-helix transcriptional regulator [Actinoplanes sp.]|nr:helix-turn-helix transcriptional regulator [Actinoplanes sp.]
MRQNDVRQRRGGPADGLSGSDRTLLRLLALGVTDEAAARRMGVSVRTIRRHVSQLLDRLDAVSRFQAGVQAAQRGWL